MRAAGARPSGTLRLNLPKLAAGLVLAPAFGRFTRDYPEVQLELMVDDGLVDVIAAGFDAGIRPGERVHRDMVAVRVSPDMRAAVVGSPGYFASRPPPGTPHDLGAHSCVNYRFTASRALYRWPFARAGESLEVVVEGALTVNDTDLIRAAALEGAGLAYTLEDTVADDLAAGRLVRVLEDWCQPFPGFFLYYPGRRQVPPALRALIDVLRVAAP